MRLSIMPDGSVSIANDIKGDENFGNQNKKERAKTRRRRKNRVFDMFLSCRRVNPAAVISSLRHGTNDEDELSDSHETSSCIMESTSSLDDTTSDDFLPESELADHARRSYDLGVVHMANGDIDAARGKFTDALHATQIVYGRSHWKVARVQERLGDIASLQGNHDEIHYYYDAALNRTRIRFGVRNNEVASRILMKKAAAYSKAGEADNARICLAMILSDTREGRNEDEIADLDYY